MQNVSTITKPKIDVPSIILSTIGFGGIVYGFSSVGEKGWGSTIVILDNCDWNYSAYSYSL